MTERKVRRGTSGLLHGVPGAGKSTLLHTMPGPRLIVDAEMGDDEFEGDVIVLPWDDWEDSGRDRALLTPKTSVIVDCEGWEDYRMAVNFFLRDKRRRFRSIGLDSLTRIQEQMEEDMSPLDRRRIKPRHRDFDHFGALLDYIKADLEDLHALTKTRGICAWWVCQTAREQTPKVPQLTGQLRQRIAHIPDIVGFLRAEVGLDEEGHRDEWWTLDISSTSEGEAKCRRRKVRQKWGSEIPDPNLARIASIASPRPKKEKTSGKAT